jgi:hypothetical protein
MDNSLVFVMMICVGMLMAVLPFGVFMGLGTVLEIQASDTRLVTCYILLALILSYVLALVAFSLIQSNSTGKYNIKQVAANAGISLALQSITLFLVWLIPSLRGLVTNLLPPDSEEEVTISIGYSYWSFWAALFSVAIGGTLSGVSSEAV